MLDKPIIFFDVETTGTDVAKDRIVQFAAIRVHSLAQTGAAPEDTLKLLINPGIPIPAEVTAIHGITDEMVTGEPMINIQAQKIQNFMEGCDLSGYNIKRFDIPILAEEFSRAGLTFSLKGRKVIDPFILYKILNSQSLGAAYKKYTGTELEGAHDAMNDVVASFRVLQDMIQDKHVPDDIDGMIKFQRNGEEFDDTVDFAGKFKRRADGEIILNFGKYRNELAKHNIGFLNWMLDKDFTVDTRAWAEEIIASEMGTDNGTFDDGLPF